MSFIVVMDMNGIRKSHPNEKLIGKHFKGGDEGTSYMVNLVRLLQEVRLV